MHKCDSCGESFANADEIIRLAGDIEIEVSERYDTFNRTICNACYDGEVNAND